MTTFFSSESVSEGHPDKVCDAVSDALVDLHLRKDMMARCAIETMATTNRVIIAGETATAKQPTDEEMQQTVRETIRRIGYEQEGFDWRQVKIENLLHRQSADIALGVDKQGAGDQGIMFGYAKAEKGYDTEFMPLPIYLAHKILRALADWRRQNPACGLQPDAKSQVTAEYDAAGKVVTLPKIVVSTQHNANLSLQDVRGLVRQVLTEVLPSGLMPKDEASLLVNPTGRFVVGGPDGDAGLTGRKIIVDTYGGAAPHGGGAFSGKDATKVDRSAAYMLRYLAKNIVAAGLAEECLLQIAYAIGVAEPLSLYINTNRTAKVPETDILKWLRRHVDLTPAGIITRLKLRRPIYLPTSSYGHFGRKPGADGSFSWEQTDMTEELRDAF